MDIFIVWRCFFASHEKNQYHAACRSEVRLMNTQPDNSIPESDRYVVLNIRTLMADRNIRSVAALQRLLIAAGVDISNQQLNRIVDNRATLLNLTVINGLLKVLKCSVHELFGEMVVPKHTDREHKN